MIGNRFTFTLLSTDSGAMTEPLIVNALDVYTIDFAAGWLIDSGGRTRAHGQLSILGAPLAGDAKLSSCRRPIPNWTHALHQRCSYTRDQKYGVGRRDGALMRGAKDYKPTGCILFPVSTFLVHFCLLSISSIQVRSPHCRSTFVVHFTTTQRRRAQSIRLSPFHYSYS